MKTKTDLYLKVKRILVYLGFIFMVPVIPWFNIQTAYGGEWTWSLRMAIHELKFYPEQLFPDLVYPVNWDKVQLPQPINSSTIHVPQGSIVTWVNKDRILNDQDGKWNMVTHLILILNEDGRPTAQSLPLMEMNQTFSTNFDKVGDFEYICMIHPQLMRGNIKVLPWGMEVVRRK